MLRRSYHLEVTCCIVGDVAINVVNVHSTRCIGYKAMFEPVGIAFGVEDINLALVRSPVFVLPSDLRQDRAVRRVHLY